MVPPHVCMVPQHVKCLPVLYESYGTLYLIWNRYHMVPPHVCMVPPHVLYDSYGPHTLYGIGILWSLLTSYGTAIVWSPHMYVWSPHVKCLHVLYDSYDPPYLICNRYCMVPHLYNMMSMTLMVPHTLYGIGI